MPLLKIPGICHSEFAESGYPPLKKEKRKKAGKVSKWITGGGATATVISIVAFYKQIREALVSFFD